MYKLKFYPYCGLDTIHEDFETREEAREAAAKQLKRARRNYPVVTTKPGFRWEILEPDDTDLTMVPDDCGILALKHVTFECRECGSACETQEDAWNCCQMELEEEEEEEENE